MLFENLCDWLPSICDVIENSFFFTLKLLCIFFIMLIVFIDISHMCYKYYHSQWYSQNKLRHQRLYNHLRYAIFHNQFITFRENRKMTSNIPVTIQNHRSILETISKNTHLIQFILRYLFQFHFIFHRKLTFTRIHTIKTLKIK